MYKMHVLDIRHYGELYCEELPTFGEELAHELIFMAVFDRNEVCERRMLILLEALEGHEKLTDLSVSLLVSEGLTYFATAREHLQQFKNAHCIVPLRCDRHRFALIV